MWVRYELKQRAKDVLRWNYWKSLLISFVLVIAGASGGGGGINFSIRDWSSRNYDNIFNFNTNHYNTFDRVLGLRNAIIIAIVIFVLIMLAFTISLAIRIFLGYSLEVGGRRFFVRSAENTDNKKCFSFAFAGQNYMGIVKTMLLRGIQNFLWYLLFIIPGIVKSYSYSMVPYILGDNPNIGARRAIQLSQDMTYGHKLDIFVLEFSFIGWYLLGVLALFVGVYFVKPYEDATKAELYLVLRQNALDNNMCTYSELGLNDTEGLGI